MVSSALDPLRVPEGFWLRDDVGDALDHRSVYHCHILDHEDAGMMAVVNVLG